jgi:hypothetical protein
MQLTVCDEETEHFFPNMFLYLIQFGGTLLVAQLAETLRYQPESRGFDSLWCHLNFSLT